MEIVTLAHLATMTISEQRSIKVPQTTGYAGQAEVVVGGYYDLPRLGDWILAFYLDECVD